MTLLTREEAAKMLRVCLRTLDYWCTDEKIRYRRIGGRKLFLLEDLEAFVNARAFGPRITAPAGTQRNQHSFSPEPSIARSN